MYTLQDCQKDIHHEYDGDTNYYEVGTEDYNLRLGFIHSAIRQWASELTNWKELYVNLSQALDGDTITNGGSEHSLPSDFDRMNSIVYVGDMYYQYQHSREKLTNIRVTNVNNVYHLIGNARTGKKIRFSPVPNTGLSLNYDYYKTPYFPTLGTDIIEMSKPLYIVNYVVGKLRSTDRQGRDYQSFNDMANQIMDQMKIENENVPYGTDNSIISYDEEIKGGVFGL